MVRGEPVSTVGIIGKATVRCSLVAVLLMWATIRSSHLGGQVTVMVKRIIEEPLEDGKAQTNPIYSNWMGNTSHCIFPHLCPVVGGNYEGQV